MLVIILEENMNNIHNYNGRVIKQFIESWAGLCHSHSVCLEAGDLEEQWLLSSQC